MKRMSRRDKAMFSLGCKVGARSAKTTAKRKRTYKTRRYARSFY